MILYKAIIKTGIHLLHLLPSLKATLARTCRPTGTSLFPQSDFIGWNSEGKYMLENYINHILKPHLTIQVFR